MLRFSYSARKISRPLRSVNINFCQFFLFSHRDLSKLVYLSLTPDNYSTRVIEIFANKNFIIFLSTRIKIRKKATHVIIGKTGSIVLFFISLLQKYSKYGLWPMPKTNASANEGKFLLLCK